MSLPELEEFEPAARLWCEHQGVDPDEKVDFTGNLRWRAIANRLRDHWFMNWCLARCGQVPPEA